MYIHIYIYADRFMSTRTQRKRHPPKALVHVLDVDLSEEALCGPSGKAGTTMMTVLATSAAQRPSTSITHLSCTAWHVSLGIPVRPPIPFRGSNIVRIRLRF